MQPSPPQATRPAAGRRERSALLALLRGARLPHDARRDDAALAALAADQGVAAAALERLPPDEPETLRAPLQRARDVQAAANALRFRELAAALETLRARGHEPLLLKGPAAVMVVHHDLGARGFRDADLLLPRAQAADAQAVLLAAGWTLLPRMPDPAWYRRYHHHEAPLRRAEGGLVLELHRDLLPPGAPRQLDAAAVLARGRRSSFAGVVACVPDDADLALHLALNLALGEDALLAPLSKYVDLLALHGRADFPWDDWRGRVEVARAARFVRPALDWTAEALHLDLPEPVRRVLEQAGDRTAGRALAAALRRWLPMAAAGRPPLWARREILRILLQERSLLGRFSTVLGLPGRRQSTCAPPFPR